ncbi:DUF3558 domain-containing protein [Allokutzneria sp. A3M-2-11 16]|uniref:DUF3558 family protein n=1 Tax=Allokutzneria sp. A3M-2-11 16 TaxID=2962043 RepID=UPI0020B6CB4B|nr:DUF3558 family protein [Allokutzneria sp. A3M-2-11 16]MCP3804235.1 DUF3558 domain-containing protein [Allokutzneria sp. A3M-2-11 16]
MRTRLVVAALCALVLSGCTSTVVGSPAPQGAAEGENAPAQPAPPKPPRAVIALGDQYPVKDWKEAGAPFDPCTTLKWEDFPAPMRGTNAAKAQQVEPSSAFTLHCRFENSGKIAVDPGGGNAPQGRTIFLVDVLWGPQYGPQSVNNGVPVTISGKAGAQRESTFGAAKEPYCIVVMPLSKGGAGIEVRNGRFSDKGGACDVAKGLMEKLLSRVQ